MHFATFLPNWNSVESVRRAHSVLEAGALVFFALLVLFDVLAHLWEDKDKDRARLFDKIGLCFFAIAVLAEIAAYPYGQRNDRLSAEMIGSLSEKAGQAEIKARKAITDSATALSQVDAVTRRAKELDRQLSVAQNRLDAVMAKADQLEERIKWRSLTPSQQKEIAEQLQADGKWDVDILAYGDLSEIRRIADQIRSSLPSGWNSRLWFLSATTLSVTGIVVQTVEGSGKDADAVADHVVYALKKEGLLAGRFPSMPRSFNPMAGFSSGPTWDKNKMAPIRISIGTKQENIPPRR